MKLINFKPSRSKVLEDVDLVSDLDALIEKPITFRVLGKIHKIKPISTKEFFRVLNSLDRLNRLNRLDGKFTDKDLLDAYVELVGSVCETIGKSEILQMSQAQVIALVQLIIDSISGKTHAEFEKKKKFPISQIQSSDSPPVP